MKKIIDVWAHFVVKNRIAVIVAVIILIGLSVLPLKNLYFEDSTDMWFLEGDPELQRYKDLKGLFENDEYLLVGIKAPPQDDTIFTLKTLEMVKKMTDFLEEHEAVSKIRSITQFEYMHAADDSLEISELVSAEADELSDLTPEELREMAEIAKKEKIIHGQLITQDLKHTLISARIVEETGEEAEDPKIVVYDEFLTFIEKEGLDTLGIEYHIGGSAAITANFFFSSIQDQSIIYPLVMVIIVVMLIILFRSLAGVFLPFLVVSPSVIATLGFIAFRGWSMNMLNTALPALLTAIGLCDSIHIITGFYHARHSGADSKTATVESVKQYYLPCFYTTLTTSIGFIALAVSKLGPVLEFGVSSAFGVVVAFLLSVTILPAFLSFVRGKEKQIEKMASSGRFTKVLNGLPEFTITHRKIILTVTAVITVISLYCISLIQVDTSFVRNFKQESLLRQGVEYFDAAYSGGMTIEFILDSGEEGGVKDPEFMKRALEFQQYLEAHEGTGEALSALNYLLNINQVMHDNDPAYFIVPESKELAAQYLLLYTTNDPTEDLTDLMDYPERFIRISIFCKAAPSSVTNAWVEEMQQEIDTNYSDLNIEISGRTVLFNNMDIYVQQGLISSFSLALGLIIICFFVIFRSFTYGFLSLIPSVLPIIVAGGVMGISNIYLDFASMIVAAVTIGLAVDDTIHFMLQYTQAIKAGNDRKEAVRVALSHAGKGILFTSIILYCGFSFMIFSTFVPNISFGILGGIVIIFALLGDLVVLPALITVLKK